MDVRVRGEQARALLEDPVLKEALDTIEADLLIRWGASAVGAVDEREACYALHAGVQSLRAQLTAFWTAAKLEADRGKA